MVTVMVMVMGMGMTMGMGIPTFFVSQLYIPTVTHVFKPCCCNRRFQNDYNSRFHHDFSP